MGKASVKSLKQFIVLSLTWWVIFPEAGTLAKMPWIAFFLVLCRYIMIYSPYSYESCQTRHSLIYLEILYCIMSHTELMSHHFLDLNILLTALSFVFLFRTFSFSTKKCVCVYVCVCAHARMHIVFSGSGRYFWVWKILVTKWVWISPHTLYFQMTS